MPMMFRDTRWFSLWRYLLSTLLYHGVALVIAGIFVLPLVSIFMNRDLVGDLSKTQILERA